MRDHGIENTQRCSLEFLNLLRGFFSTVNFTPVGSRSVHDILGIEICLLTSKAIVALKHSLLPLSLRTLCPLGWQSSLGCSCISSSVNSWNRVSGVFLK